MSREDPGPGVLDATREFLDRAHLAAPGELPLALAEAARVIGWTAQVYLADDEQRVLIPVGPHGEDVAAPLSIDGTLAGRAFRLLEPVRAHGDDVALWLPLLDGVHRFGVVLFGFPAGTDVDSRDVKDAYRVLAENAGHLFAAKSAYGDALRRVTRLRRRSVESELLSDLLPPLSFGARNIVVSAILEPTYDVAADAFDYSVIEGVAHLAVMDATGHALPGTMLAAVALAALRNSRRESLDLAQTLGAMDRFVELQGRRESFVTAVVAELDLQTGTLRYINAGHPAPLLMRNGKVVKSLDEGRRALLGLGERAAAVGHERLEPGDRVVFYTDGVTEARAPDGTQFGLQRLVDQLERTTAGGLPAPETLRLVARDVLEYQHGVLQDDATLLVAEWSTGHELGYTAAPGTEPYA